MNIRYLLRGFNRVRANGIFETAAYSSRVALKHLRGGLLDIRYGGRLSRTAHDWKRNEQGRYANVPTDVYTLDAIFDQLTIRADDALVDVGCGDGRVIAYCLSRRLNNKIVGIELLSDAAEIAARRFAKYPNVKIIAGDATTTDAQGSIYFLFNPFEEGPTERFERMLRGRDVTIAYLNHPHLDRFSRDHWHIEEHVATKPDWRQYRFAILTPRRG
ncbi:MAG: hypothetical protein OJF48_003379 [Afipia sp.]|jgi:SAM-dependent methyltransferase|nr:MAG: hypothetical protein OJF48_003379 [Afipia sp.]